MSQLAKYYLINCFTQLSSLKPVDQQEGKSESSTKAVPPMSVALAKQGVFAGSSQPQSNPGVQRKIVLKMVLLYFRCHLQGNSNLRYSYSEGCVRQL